MQFHFFKACHIEKTWIVDIFRYNWGRCHDLGIISIFSRLHRHFHKWFQTLPIKKTVFTWTIRCFWIDYCRLITAYIDLKYTCNWQTLQFISVQDFPTYSMWNRLSDSLPTQWRLHTRFIKCIPRLIGDRCIEIIGIGCKWTCISWCGLTECVQRETTTCS